jgi:hypothetical protein
MASRIDGKSLPNSTARCEHCKRKKMTIAKSEKDPKKKQNKTKQNKTQNKGQLQAHMELQNTKI